MMIDGDGLPAFRESAARWYRRALRERGRRETVGGVAATLLDELRVASVTALRATCCGRDGEWICTIADRFRLEEAHRVDLRQLEDAAYGLRWLQLAHRLRLDPRRSPASQLPSHLLSEAPGTTGPESTRDG